jgi:hypothetical protein
VRVCVCACARARAWEISKSGEVSKSPHHGPVIFFPYRIKFCYREECIPTKRFKFSTKISLNSLYSTHKD